LNALLLCFLPDLTKSSHTSTNERIGRTVHHGSEITGNRRVGQRRSAGGTLHQAGDELEDRPAGGQFESLGTQWPGAVELHADTGISACIGLPPAMACCTGL
jgi:hypothetical protein